jgi:uncharacterized protein (TIGR02996 family)
MTLAKALTALEDGEDKAALLALLEVWRSTRAPTVIPAIETLSARLTKSQPPIKGVKGKSDRQTWLDVAARRDPLTVGRLLEAMPESIYVIERMEVLAKWEGDPRITTALLRWLAQSPFPRATFPALLPPLEAQRDPRAAAAIQAYVKAGSRDALSRFGRATWKLLPPLAERTAAWPAAKPIDEALLAKLTTRLATPPPARKEIDPAALFAAVYENPEDDSARLVLADLLQERGDPRGELIALQVARHQAGGKPTPRERELVKTWGRQWLGPLGAAFLNEGLAYTRGFVSAGRLGGSAEPGSPGWATVEHLELGERGDSSVLLSPQLRSLRHVGGVAGWHLESIVRGGRELRWRSLELRLNEYLRYARVLIGAAEIFTSLERLELISPDVDPARLTELVQARVTRGVTDLAISFPASRAGQILTSPSVQRLQTLTLYLTSGAALRFQPATRAITIAFTEADSRWVAAAAGSLSTLEPGFLTSLAIETPARMRRGNELLRGQYRIELDSIFAQAKRLGLAVE